MLCLRTKRARPIVLLLLVQTLVFAQGTSKSRPRSAAKGEWPGYGGEKSFQRYSALDLIKRGNVTNLEILWTRPAIDPALKDQFPDLNPSTYFRGTPIMVNGILYAPNGVGLVEAFDPATGQTKWVQQPVEPTLREASGQSTRGVAYWKDKAGDRIISVRVSIFMPSTRNTGRPIKDFGDNGRMSLNRQLPNNARYSGFPGPFIVRDVVVVGGNGVGSMGDGGGSSSKT